MFSLWELLNSESVCLFPPAGLVEITEAKRVITTAPCRGFYHSQTAFPISKDESRIKATVMDVKPVDYRDYGRRLIMNIRRNAAM